MEYKQNQSIKPYTTMKMGGNVELLTTVSTALDIVPAIALAQSKGLPVWILGGGSNTIFSDEHKKLAVIKIEIKGFEVIEDTDSYTDIRIGAGENWDEMVAKTVEMELSGIEAMSAIPGTVGGTPVQNVGAYGQEIKDTLLNVEAYDSVTQKFVTLSNEDCNFSYRNSIFREREKGRYIITHVTLRLSKEKPQIPDYPGVKKYFEERGIISPTLKEIREAIIDIRKNKLPDPEVIANVGSFFKNPIVDNTVSEKLKEKFPDIIAHDVGNGKSKLGAGWLIEHTGLKGKSYGPIEIYPGNALVLTNIGGATHNELEFAKNNVIKEVELKFGITLEPEPLFIN